MIITTRRLSLSLAAARRTRWQPKTGNEREREKEARREWESLSLTLFWPHFPLTGKARAHIAHLLQQQQQQHNYYCFRLRVLRRTAGPFRTKVNEREIGVNVELRHPHAAAAAGASIGAERLSRSLSLSLLSTATLAPDSLLLPASTSNQSGSLVLSLSLPASTTTTTTTTEHRSPALCLGQLEHTKAHVLGPHSLTCTLWTSVMNFFPTHFPTHGSSRLRLCVFNLPWLPSFLLSFFLLLFTFTTRLTLSPGPHFFVSLSFLAASFYC